MVELPYDFKNLLLMLLIGNTLFILLFEEIFVKMIPNFIYNRRKKIIKDVIL